jgi:putative redox protein
MVSMDIVYEGGLRCRATHGPSGTVIATDAPKDNHGRGEAFSPTDLVATAAATCMTTIMGIVAARSGVRLEGLRVQVDKEMTAQPPRRIARLVLVFTMPPGIPATERAKLEQAAHTCPVALSLHPDSKMVATFTYPD